MSEDKYGGGDPFAETRKLLDESAEELMSDEERYLSFLDLKSRWAIAIEECANDPDLEYQVPNLIAAREDDIKRWARFREREPEPETPTSNGDEPSNETQRNPSGTGFEDGERSTWLDIDLTDAVKGGEPPRPTLFERTDGERLIYPAGIGWFFGESESLKSLMTQLLTVTILKSEGRVLYFDFEDDAKSVVSRLKSFGALDEVLLDRKRFRYINPEEPTDRDQLHRHMDDGPWTVAIIDGVTEAMTMDGLNYAKNEEIAKWLWRLNRLITAYGVPTINIDHVVKDVDARDGQPIGGVVKRNASTTMIEFKLLTPFRRATLADRNGSTGKVALILRKDKHGWARMSERTSDHCWAIVEFTSWPDGGITARVLPPFGEDERKPAKDLLDEILGVIKLYDVIGTTSLRESVGRKTTDITHAIKWMSDNGWITVVRNGRTAEHRLTELGVQMYENG